MKHKGSFIDRQDNNYIFQDQSYCDYSENWLTPVWFLKLKIMRLLEFQKSLAALLNSVNQVIPPKGFSEMAKNPIFIVLKEL